MLHLLLESTPYLADGQRESNQILEFKSGPMFVGTGDIWVMNFGVKYNYQINKTFGVFIEPAYASGQNVRYSGISQTKPLPFLRSYKSMRTNIGINLNLFHYENFYLQLSPNISLVTINSSNLGGISYIGFPNAPDELQYMYSPPTIKNEQTLGAGIMIKPTLAIKKNMAIGAGLNTQSFLIGALDHSFFISFGVNL